MLETLMIFCRRAFVDVNAADLEKALKLDQTEFDGQTITVQADEKRKKDSRQSTGKISYKLLSWWPLPRVTNGD